MVLVPAAFAYAFRALRDDHHGHRSGASSRCVSRKRNARGRRRLTPRRDVTLTPVSLSAAAALLCVRASLKVSLRDDLVLSGVVILDPSTNYTDPENGALNTFDPRCRVFEEWVWDSEAVGIERRCEQGHLAHRGPRSTASPGGDDQLYTYSLLDYYAGRADPILSEQIESRSLPLRNVNNSHPFLFSCRPPPQLGGNNADDPARGPGLGHGPSDQGGGGMAPPLPQLAEYCTLATASATVENEVDPAPRRVTSWCDDFYLFYHKDLPATFSSSTLNGGGGVGGAGLTTAEFPVQPQFSATNTNASGGTNTTTNGTLIIGVTTTSSSSSLSSAALALDQALRSNDARSPSLTNRSGVPIPARGSDVSIKGFRIVQAETLDQVKNSGSNSNFLDRFYIPSYLRVAMAGPVLHLWFPELWEWPAPIARLFTVAPLVSLFDISTGGPGSVFPLNDDASRAAAAIATAQAIERGETLRRDGNAVGIHTFTKDAVRIVRPPEKLWVRRGQKVLRNHCNPSLAHHSDQQVVDHSNSALSAPSKQDDGVRGCRWVPLLNVSASVLHNLTVFDALQLQPSGSAGKGGEGAGNDHEPTAAQQQKVRAILDDLDTSPEEISSVLLDDPVNVRVIAKTGDVEFSSSRVPAARDSGSWSEVLGTRELRGDTDLFLEQLAKQVRRSNQEGNFGRVAGGGAGSSSELVVDLALEADAAGSVEDQYLLRQQRHQGFALMFTDYNSTRHWLSEYTYSAPVLKEGGPLFAEEGNSSWLSANFSTPTAGAGILNATGPSAYAEHTSAAVAYADDEAATTVGAGINGASSTLGTGQGQIFTSSSRNATGAGRNAVVFESRSAADFPYRGEVLAWAWMCTHSSNDVSGADFPWWILLVIGVVVLAAICIVGLCAAGVLLGAVVTPCVLCCQTKKSQEPPSAVQQHHYQNQGFIPSSQGYIFNSGYNHGNQHGRHNVDPVLGHGPGPQVSGFGVYPVGHQHDAQMIGNPALGAHSSSQQIYLVGVGSHNPPGGLAGNGSVALGKPCAA